MIGRRLAFASVFICLLSPFLILFVRFPTWSPPPASELAAVFGFTALQAALSALASVLIGSIGALGLMAYPGRAWPRMVALAPNAVPALLVILAAMNVWPGIRGLAGIVFAHVLLNAGLVAVSVAALLATRVAGLADLAYIEGATRRSFLARGALPLISGDLARLFLFVFALCFSSFAVPLVIGGSRATTVEVLIYEQIRVAPDWSAALAVAALQTLAILALSLLAGGTARSPIGAARGSPLLEWRPGVAFALAPAAIVVAGLVVRLPQGLAQGLGPGGPWPGFGGELPRLLAGSAFTATLSGILCMAGLVLIAFARPRGWGRRFLLGFVAPSSALTGFALLLLWRDTGWASLVKIAVGITLISLPAFHRLRWDGALDALSGQVAVARALGASEPRIFARVMMPQLWGTCAFLGGLSAFWAWGDFALSAVVGERALTLAMLAHGLLGSYRLGLATLVVCAVLIGGSLNFALFWGVGRVFGSRAQT